MQSSSDYCTGLSRDVSDVVFSDQLFDQDTVAELATRAEALQDELYKWIEDYKVHCVRMSLVMPTKKDIATRREIFGTSLECLILTKRLIATVQDSARIRLESEVQAIANAIVELQQQPPSENSWLFTGHETDVAHAAQNTRGSWMEDVICDTVRRSLATRSRYLTWSNALTRVTNGTPA